MIRDQLQQVAVRVLKENTVSDTVVFIDNIDSFVNQFLSRLKESVAIYKKSKMLHTDPTIQIINWFRVRPPKKAKLHIPKTNQSGSFPSM
jgi:hypothetical protein